MAKFHKGEKIKEAVKTELKPASSGALSISEVVYALMMVRKQKFPEMTKLQLLAVVSEGWDVFEHVEKTFNGAGTDPKTDTE